MFRNNDEVKESCKQGSLVMFQCGYCGDVITYHEDQSFNQQDFINKNRCHTVSINGTGYGSECTEVDINIPCCDKCANGIRGKAKCFYGEE